MNNEFFDNPKLPADSIIVFIEEFDRAGKTILFDFIDKISFINFINEAGVEIDPSGPSMILVKNYLGKNVQEDTFYILNKTSIKILFTQNLATAVNDSLIIAYTVDLKSSDIVLFKHSLSLKTLKLYRTIEVRAFELPNNFFEGSGLNSSIKVNIRNVGQGNWNEVVINGINRIIFDIGTNKEAKEQDLRKYMSLRDELYQKDQPILILSHWDVDHYHCLLAANDDTISSFTYFIFRNCIPTQTAIRVYDKFEKLNSRAMFPIAPFNEMDNRRSTRLQSFPICPSGSYLLFNSFYNKSRNKNALGLLIRRKHSSVVFSGDYDYRQVSNYMLTEIYSPNNHYLIVPHHGGNAGKYIYNIKSRIKLELAIISVGSNTYEHPYEENIKYLETSGFKKVIRTDHISNDFEFAIM